MASAVDLSVSGSRWLPPDAETGLERDREELSTMRTPAGVCIMWADEALSAITAITCTLPIAGGAEHTETCSSDDQCVSGFAGVAVLPVGA